MLALFRIAPLAIAGALSASLVINAFQQPLPYLLFAIVVGIYVLITHKANMQRLFAASKSRIGKNMSKF